MNGMMTINGIIYKINIRLKLLEKVKGSYSSGAHCKGVYVAGEENSYWY
jgi:hypothetical protein